MFIRLSDNAYPISEQQIRAANPSTTFPVPFKPTSAYAPVLKSPLPEYNPQTQWVREAQPVLLGQNWIQQWQVVNYTPEELAALPQPSVPYEVTMRQARLALLEAGLLSEIEPAINALPSPQKEQALIEWEYSSTVQRQNGFVSSLASALNLSGAQLDALFIAAAQK